MWGLAYPGKVIAPQTLLYSTTELPDLFLCGADWIRTSNTIYKYAIILTKMMEIIMQSAPFKKMVIIRLSVTLLGSTSRT